MFPGGLCPRPADCLKLECGGDGTHDVQLVNMILKLY